MKSMPSAGELHLMKDKLRAITDESWVREGNIIKCGVPLNKGALQIAVENLAHFGLYPDEVPTRRGTSLTLEINSAHMILGAVSNTELNEWSLGIG